MCYSPRQKMQSGGRISNLWFRPDQFSVIQRNMRLISNKEVHTGPYDQPARRQTPPPTPPLHQKVLQLNSTHSFSRKRTRDVGYNSLCMAQWAFQCALVFQLEIITGWKKRSREQAELYYSFAHSKQFGRWSKDQLRMQDSKGPLVADLILVVEFVFFYKACW